MADARNYDYINKGFDLLYRGLSLFIYKKLRQQFRDRWWIEGVYDRLYDDQRRNIATSGKDSELLGSLDISILLLLLNLHWRDIFRQVLPNDCRSWAEELRNTRNETAHRGWNDASDDDAYRDLDTMTRLCREVELPESRFNDGSMPSDRIDELKRIVRYGNVDGSSKAEAKSSDKQLTKKQAKLAETYALSGYPSWRDVIKPHPDVAGGLYRKAEFAADLNQVARGRAAIEYQDAVEFFQRTYVTEGMQNLLVQALQRVTSGNGEPVVQLKTAFGGGKTHSMLALYHLMKSGGALLRNRETRAILEPTLKDAGVESLPQVHVVTIVGTALDPSTYQQPAYLPGMRIHTLWGEIAAQLCRSTGDNTLYRNVRQADKNHVSPGSNALRHLFDKCGSCLILIDELVAYAKKLYGAEGLEAGSFDNLITFIQELTEAARASKNTIVVASIPESEREIGGDAGQRALEAIEHTFGRMEAIWKPVSVDEGFEIVSRRLFQDCEDEEKRDAVCRAFSELYQANSQDFPMEARELDYLNRMKACYPIHPEIYDRLYEDWSTLEGFQRTRGVLRFMAAVIHQLWVANDKSALIMPGSLPLYDASVQDELTRYLNDGWTAVVSTEVDGEGALPRKIDEANPRLQQNTATLSAARTVFLGSAPDAAGQGARGVEMAHVLLGTVQPGENSAVFRDAILQLRRDAQYFYTDESGSRFWYDTKPTLAKTVADRVAQMQDDIAEAEIRKRLQKMMQRRNPFASVQRWPMGSSEVPDTKDLKLVFLDFRGKHSTEFREDPAQKAAQELLANHGNAPRTYKNTVVFVAPDSSRITPLLQETKRYLAWEGIYDDRERLNLDAVQSREALNNQNMEEKNIEALLDDCYKFLLYPFANGAGAIEWDVITLRSSQNTVDAAGQQLRSEEAVIDEWAPMLLKKELDQYGWRGRDSIGIGEFWEQLCKYCYYPRLVSYDVLERSVRAGLGSGEYFGIAAGYEDGRYVDLHLGDANTQVYPSSLLVKTDVAKAQIDAERRAADMQEKDPDIPQATPPAFVRTPPMPFVEPKPPVQSITKHHFVLNLDLEIDGAITQVNDVIQEIINNLNSNVDARTVIGLSVDIETKQGFTGEDIKIVEENLRTLGLDDYEFSE